MRTRVSSYKIGEHISLDSQRSLYFLLIPQCSFKSDLCGDYFWGYPNYTDMEVLTVTASQGSPVKTECCNTSINPLCTSIS